MTIRAFFRAVQVDTAQPPYNTLHLKIIYPAKMSGGELEQNWGIIPVDSQQAPFPVVIFFSGVNCSLDIYQWLAVKLAERGLVVVTFNWVAENIPGIISLTPGVDLTSWKPETYGTRPTALALSALLTELEQLQAEGILAGMLNLQQIILGGHSAGGRVAIESANPEFFSSIVAAFAYGAHTLGGVNFGYKPGTILPLPDLTPLLLMGGTCDGVIANSSHRYGITSTDATTPVSRTFSEAITGGRKDNYLVLLEGSNHFSIADPFDSITGQAFLDFPASKPEKEIRSLMAEIIGLFIDTHVRQKAEASQALQQLLENPHPLLQSFEVK